MAIVLIEHIHTAKLVRSGHEATIAVSAGQSIKIETSPSGEELLNETCPAGKMWTAQIIVEITETDA